MNWLKELLEKAVITDGVLDVDALMTAVNTEFPKNAVPKDTYNTLAETKKQLDLDVAERDKQLKELGETAGLSKGLKEQIETLQGENKTAKEQYESDLKDLTMTNAIKLALNGKVHDEELAAGLIDKEKLVIGDNGIVGLDEQLTGLKESKAFLFKTEETPNPTPQIVAGGNPDGGNNQEADPFAAKLAKYN